WRRGAGYRGPSTWYLGPGSCYRAPGIGCRVSGIGTLAACRGRFRLRRRFTAVGDAGRGGGDVGHVEGAFVGELGDDFDVEVEVTALQFFPEGFFQDGDAAGGDVGGGGDLHRLDLGAGEALDLAHH